MVGLGDTATKKNTFFPPAILMYYFFILKSNYITFTILMHATPEIFHCTPVVDQIKSSMMMTAIAILIKFQLFAQPYQTVYANFFICMFVLHLWRGILKSLLLVVPLGKTVITDLA